MKIVTWSRVILMAFLVTLVGCITTTALYGNKFEAAGNDVYTLKVMYGGNEFRTSGIDKTARKTVAKEAEKFLVERDEYTSYEILEFKRILVPSHLLYTVKFAAE